MTRHSARAVDSPQPRNYEIAALLAAVAVASVGHSVVLPFLPELVDRASGQDAGGSTTQHVAALAATFPTAACLAAPLWARIADRWSLRNVFLLSLFGFGATLALYARSDVPQLYLLRALGGVFAAGITPTAFAMAAHAADGQQQARRFTWLNALVVAGDLGGPLTGELSAAVGWSPFAVPAALCIAALAGAIRVPRGSIATARRERHPDERRGALFPVLFVAATAAGGLTMLHTTLTIQADIRGLSRSSLSTLLALCGLVMLAAQIGTFRGRKVAANPRALLHAMLAILAAVLVTAAYATELWVLGAVLVAAGWSAAMLRLLTSVLAARGPAATRTWALSLQFSAVSAGQAGAAFAAGWAGNSGLWIAAGAAMLAAGTVALRAHRC